MYIHTHVVGLALYFKNKADHPGSYFPRNSFVTNLNASSLYLRDISGYQIVCNYIQSGIYDILWYYGTNNTKVKLNRYRNAYVAENPWPGSYSILRRVEARNPMNLEFYCKRNGTTAWFGMFVNQSKIFEKKS